MNEIQYGQATLIKLKNEDAAEILMINYKLISDRILLLYFITNVHPFDKRKETSNKITIL